MAHGSLDIGMAKIEVEMPEYLGKVLGKVLEILLKWACFDGLIKGQENLSCF